MEVFIEKRYRREVKQWNDKSYKIKKKEANSSDTVEMALMSHLNRV